MDDGEWEVAAKSHNAARRKKRKQARWANRAAAAQADHKEEEAHHLEGTADGGDSQDWETDGRARPSYNTLQNISGWGIDSHA